MVDVAAKDATELFFVARKRADLSTLRTSLRGVRSGHFYDPPSVPGELVLKHGNELRPSCSCDATSKAVILEHTLDVELLDDHRAVTLGVSGRQLVQNVIPLSPDLAMDTVHTVQGSCSVLGSFLPPAHSSLSVTKSLQRPFKMCGIWYLVSVGVSEQVDDSSIDGHYGFHPRARVGDLVLAQDAGEPLIPVSEDRAGLCFAFKLSMTHDLQRSELGEMQLSTCELPDLWVWLANSQPVSSFSLPARLICEFLEASLPSLVQLNKQLSTHVARDFGDPWELSSQLGQLVDLIKGGNVLPLITRTGETDQSLLVCQVPQTAQGALPANQNSGLLPIRIEPKTKPLANKHDFSSLFLVYATVKRYVEQQRGGRASSSP